MFHRPYDDEDVSLSDNDPMTGDQMDFQEWEPSAHHLEEEMEGDEEEVKVEEEEVEEGEMD